MAPSTEEGQALGTGRLVASGAAEGGRLLRRLVLGPGLRLFSGWFLFSGGGPKPIPSGHGAFPAFAQQTQASYLGGGHLSPLLDLISLCLLFVCRGYCGLGTGSPFQPYVLTGCSVWPALLRCWTSLGGSCHLTLIRCPVPPISLFLLLVN